MKVKVLKPFIKANTTEIVTVGQVVEINKADAAHYLQYKMVELVEEDVIVTPEPEPEPPIETKKSRKRGA